MKLSELITLLSSLEDKDIKYIDVSIPVDYEEYQDEEFPVEVKKMTTKDIKVEIEEWKYIIWG